MKTKILRVISIVLGAVCMASGAATANDSQQLEKMNRIAAFSLGRSFPNMDRKIVYAMVVVPEDVNGRKLEIDVTGSSRAELLSLPDKLWLVDVPQGMLSDGLVGPISINRIRVTIVDAAALGVSEFRMDSDLRGYLAEQALLGRVDAVVSSVSDGDTCGSSILNETVVTLRRIGNDQGELKVKIQYHPSYAANVHGFWKTGIQVGFYCVENADKVYRSGELYGLRRIFE